MTARSHLSTAGLLRRQFLAGPGASIAVAVLVLVAAFLAIAVPRAVAALHTAALAEQLAALPADELDLTTETRAHPDAGPSASGTTLDDDVDAVWGHQEELLTGIRDALPQPLRGITGAPLASLVMGPVRAVVPGATPSSPVYRVLPGFDPRFREHAVLTSGDWPAPVDGPLDGTAAVEIVLADAVAERMEWELGEERFIGFGAVNQPLRLVGTIAPADADAGFWTHVPTALEPSVVDNGLAPPEITAAAFVDATAWTAFSQVNLPVIMQAWIPCCPNASPPTRPRGSWASSASSRAACRRSAPANAVGWVSTVGEVGFLSGLGAALGEAAVAAAASDAVLATIASGPIGVMIAVLVLGARVVFERRRAGLELAAARGASVGQLRGILAMEGLAIGVPAAIVGGAVGMLAVDADAGAGGWLLAAAFAVTPAVLLVASAPALSPLRRARADLGGAGRGRFRWIGELLVVLLAAAAVVLLLRRGLATSAAQTGVDPLLAAVPLLLSLVACIVVLRLYPIPLARLVRATAARPGLVPFLGSARALRDPSAGLVPVLAVVVGVSVAVFSVGAARHRARRHRPLGGRAGRGGCRGLRPAVHARAARRVPRGARASRRSRPSTRPAGRSSAIDGRQRSTTLIVIDTAEMRAVQAGRADATPLPEALAATPAATACPCCSRRLVDGLVASADDVGARRRAVPGRRPSSTSTTAYSPRGDWVLMDRAERRAVHRHARAAGRARATSRRARMSQRSPPRSPTIAGAGRDRGHARRASPRSSPRDRPRGLVTALVAAIVLASLLTALAIVLTLVVGPPGARAAAAAARPRSASVAAASGRSWPGRSAPVAVVAVVGRRAARRRAAVRRAAGRRPARVHRRRRPAGRRVRPVADHGRARGLGARRPRSRPPRHPASATA